MHGEPGDLELLMKTEGRVSVKDDSETQHSALECTEQCQVQRSRICKWEHKLSM